MGVWRRAELAHVDGERGRFPGACGVERHAGGSISVLVVLLRGVAAALAALAALAMALRAEREALRLRQRRDRCLCVFC